MTSPESRPDPLEHGLIRTKLTRPELPAEQVERPRLLERLDAASERRVTLIAAPAGYGKTTLALQWLRQRDGELVWISLDSGDNDPERFARYLVAGFDSLLPDALPRTRALLGAMTAPPWSYLAQVLLSELSELDAPITLAFDDFETVNSDEVHRVVSTVVENLPSQMHILALSRNDPFWPLARWRAKGWLTEIRQRDLRFEIDEVRALFAGADSAALSDDDVGLLSRKTEGWIAGLQLARLSLSRAEDPRESVRRFSGSDRLIADYLMEEVLAAQPHEVRRLLAVTAGLDRFCAPLCNHLLPEGRGGGDAAGLLARLERENLFLIPLDEEHRWFRYHHLFGELLIDHLPEASSEDLRRHVALHAAEWFAREGLDKEALRLWIEAGDLDAAANYLGTELNAILDEDYSLRVLRRLLALFPPGAEHGRLPLLVAHAYVAIVLFDVQQLAALLDEAEVYRGYDPQPGEAETGDFGADLDALRAYLHAWSGEPEKAIEYGKRALKRLSDDDIGKARLTAEMYTAASLNLVGRSEECVSFLTEAIRREDARGGKRSGGLRNALAYLRRMTNDLAGAQFVAQEAEVALQMNRTDRYFSGETYYLLGALALERGLIDRAADCFERVAELRYQVVARAYQDALIGLALVAERRGDREALERSTREVWNWAGETGNKDCLRAAESFDRRLAARAGSAVPTVPAPAPAHDAVSPWLEVPSISHAEILVTHPDAEVRRGALPYIEEAIAAMASVFNAYQVLRLAVLRAVALAEAGRRDEALDELGRAIAAAGPQGFVRPFADGGARTATLLEELAETRGRTRFIDRVLGAVTSSTAIITTSWHATASVAEGTPFYERLTLRELETLELLAQRLSNKEIAARLKITPGAVNKRLLGIYTKLGVHGRREAVAEAKARGILHTRTV